MRTSVTVYKNNTEMKEEMDKSDTFLLSLKKYGYLDGNKEKIKFL